MGAINGSNDVRKVCNLKKILFDVCNLGYGSGEMYILTSAP